MKPWISYVGKVLGGMKSYRVMVKNVKRNLYEGVAVPTTLYWAEVLCCVWS